MGLLDSVIGALGQSSGGTGAGGQGDLLNAVIGMLAGGGASSAAGAGGGMGGLGDLVRKFEQNGLGDVVNSWIGTGANQPVEPDQLGRVLGHDQVAGMAQQTGLNPSDLLGQLSQLLPQVVDKVTPGGQLPRAGGMGGMGDLAGMLGSLLKR